MNCCYSVDGSEVGSPLRFGQPFAISTTAGYAGNVSLRFEIDCLNIEVLLNNSLSMGNPQLI